jgi:signal transduction histidine kinase
LVRSVDPASIDILRKDRPVMKFLDRSSLSRQFLVASFPILLVAMLVIGLWVAHEIERGVVNRLGAVTSLYVDSLVAPHMQHLLDADTLDAPHRKTLDALLTDTPLGQHIVAFNIWRPDGRIAYSTNASAIGKAFPVGPGFGAALGGDLYSKIIDRAEQAHGFVHSDWPPRLIETYTPIHAETLGRIVGVAEFYQRTDELVRETTTAQLRSWLVVAATMSIMYLLLFGVVRRGSQTIVAQRRELGERVAELSRLLERNAKLDAKVRGAAARATAVNERFLRRISADLHDGPGQDLGYALMRLEAVADECVRTPPGGAPGPLGEDIRAVQASLESALGELRVISAGLQLPDVENLSTSEIAARAVRDYERKTGAKPVLVSSGAPVESSLPVKIALYRLLQESLANGFRHANAAEQRVTLSRANGQLVVEVRDSGPGFSASESADHGRIGLAGMRERVEALGGSFELHSAPGRGTTVKASLPAQVPGADDE